MLLAALGALSCGAARQQTPQFAPDAAAPIPETVAPATPLSAPDFLIGPDDVLQIVFWRDKDMTGDYAVRPDGMITLPLLNDIQAAGLAPEQLRARITEAAKRWLEEPIVTVIVKTINSRKVFITGSVERPGTYPLTTRTTVLQLIATAGGLKEYAKRNEIRVLRSIGGRDVGFKFDYDKVVKGFPNRNLELRPSDTVVVP